MYIDLHTHTTYSDGSMSPSELVRHAKARGLSAVAITDHDIVEGIDEAREEGRKIGIEVVAGLEISVDFKPEMHILGYFLHHTHTNIKDVLDTLRNGREERNKKIVGKLNELGFQVSVDEIKSAAEDGTVGRPHIAKVLMEKGYVKSIEEAFNKYLHNGGVAYFRREELSPPEAISEIRKAGGMAVLAHPMFLGRNMKELDELFAWLKSEGLAGVEAYYSEHTHKETGNILRLLQKHQLIATGGSDFHGTYKPSIEIGSGHGNLKVPYELLHIMKGLDNV